MDKLIELGISDNDLKNIIEQVPSIMNMDNEEVKNKIDILTYVGCNLRHIKNIVVSNPSYLERIDEDILKLISYLRKVGFTCLYLLFDSNPYFLNYDVFEIKNYIDKQISNGISLEDIIDNIYSNPYVIDEE